MTQTHHIPMSDAERGQVNTAAAELYEAFFVPALFGQFPDPVLDHAGVGPGSRVLDVGCGTGVLARAAHRRVGAGGAVVGVDPNAGMRAVAHRSAPSIEWRDGVAEDLPFDDGTFDHAISQFAAMFFTDRGRAIAEMARVTAPGGAVTLVTWAGLDRTPGYAAMVDLIANELGEEAANALRAPFVLGRPDDLASLLEPVGSEVRLREIPGTARFASIADWVHTDVRGWTLADLVDDEGEAALVARAEQELGRFVGPDGSVTFPSPALVGRVAVDA